MKYVLFVALLSTLSASQAGDLDMESGCATRPYVGVCPEADWTEAAENRVVIQPEIPVSEPDCSTHPYVGVCDMAAGD
jgi:hypothetical protein